MSRKEDGSKTAAILGAIGAIGLVVVGIISAPVVSSRLDAIPSDTWQKVAATIGSVGGAIIGVGFVLWFMIIVVNGATRAFSLKNLSIRITKDNLLPKETALFEIHLETRVAFTRGYIAMMITNQFGEVTTIITHARQASPEVIGDLRGEVKRTLQARWVVPPDAVAGQYTARLAVHDIRADEFNFLKETDYVLRGETIPFSVISPPQEVIEVSKARRVQGGICIWVSNPTANNYKEATGRAVIDNDELNLYDYKQYLSNLNGSAKKMDLYSIFDIANNATKLLFVPTFKETKIIKVTLDIGQTVIEKELALS